MPGKHFLCSADGCTTMIAPYRQCAVCPLELGYCDQHQGGTRAEDEMRIHIARDHPRPKDKPDVNHPH